jgi:hypothetical protein
MATFYVLPPRPLVASVLTKPLQDLLPGYPGIDALRAELLEALATSLSGHPDVYLVHREELPDEELCRALPAGLGAEPGDTVIEVSLLRAPDQWTARQWQIRAAA